MDETTYGALFAVLLCVQIALIVFAIKTARKSAQNQARLGFLLDELERRLARVPHP